jgi:hypothetical protein
MRGAAKCKVKFEFHAMSDDPLWSLRGDMLHNLYRWLFQIIGDSI